MDNSSGPVPIRRCCVLKAIWADGIQFLGRFDVEKSGDFPFSNRSLEKKTKSLRLPSPGPGWSGSVRLRTGVRPLEIVGSERLQFAREMAILRHEKICDFLAIRIRLLFRNSLIP